MAKFVVDTNAVAGSAASLSSLAHEFDQQLEAANDAVMRVVGASWDGPAAQKFAEAWHMLIADAGVMREALASLSARLHAAERTYETTESARISVETSAAVQLRGLKKAPVNVGSTAQPK